MLTECVRSVLALPLHPGEREILLIDDGSTVPAPEYDGITVVRQENQGLSAARNKGLELAQGEYIQFLDADDFLLDEAYRQVLDMQLSIRPDILMFGFTHDIPRGNKLKSVAYFHCGTDLLRTHNIRGSACCYLFRKSILGDLRFLPGIVHEDELFTTILTLRSEHIFCLRQTLVMHRVRKASTMGKKYSKFNIHCYLTVFDELFNFQNSDIIRQFAQYTLSKVFYTGHTIPFVDKFSVFLRAMLSGYLKYIGLKSILVFWLKR